MTCRAIGSLRQRVRLEEPRRIELSGGAANITWSRVTVLCASVEALKGTEIEIAHRMVGRVSHRIVIRYRAGVAPAMRFVCAGRTFDIIAAIDRDGRRRWLECQCQERQSQERLP